jgi:hypothetical protein
MVRCKFPMCGWVRSPQPTQGLCSNSLLLLRQMSLGLTGKLFLSVSSRQSRWETLWACRVLWTAPGFELQVFLPLISFELHNLKEKWTRAGLLEIRINWGSLTGHWKGGTLTSCSSEPRACDFRHPGTQIACGGDVSACKRTQSWFP